MSLRGASQTTEYDPVSETPAYSTVVATRLFGKRLDAHHFLSAHFEENIPKYSSLKSSD